jgi:hypothetical protein
MNRTAALPPAALTLGYAGLLPQIIAVAMVASGSGWRWAALAGGWAYAALIFSFLGGVWWGLALARPEVGRAAYVAAVAPSLIALASFIPWTIGAEWPAPALAILGTCLLLSPLVDRAIAQRTALPAGWLRLRVVLSGGLGTLTIALAAMARLS